MRSPYDEHPMDRQWEQQERLEGLERQVAAEIHRLQGSIMTDYEQKEEIKRLGAEVAMARDQLSDAREVALTAEARVAELDAELTDSEATITTLKQRLDEQLTRTFKADEECERLRLMTIRLGSQQPTSKAAMAAVEYSNSAQAERANRAEAALTAAESESAGLRARLEGVRNLADRYEDESGDTCDDDHQLGIADAKGQAASDIRAALAEPTTGRGGGELGKAIDAMQGAVHRADDLFIEKMSVREPVRWFAEQMERKLAEHDDRGGWEDCDWGFLLDRLREEVRELDETIDETLVPPPIPQRTIDEAADVANFAMMIADQSRGWLPAPSKEPTTQRSVLFPEMHPHDFEPSRADHTRCGICGEGPHTRVPAPTKEPSE